MYLNRRTLFFLPLFILFSFELLSFYPPLFVVYCGGSVVLHPHFHLGLMEGCCGVWFRKEFGELEEGLEEGLEKVEGSWESCSPKQWV